ncbi:MAG: hypothetical protein U0797_18270 [Gemmataceae bacterium]
MPTSTEFWSLAETRLKDAEGLLGIQRWDCAYYVAGYVVECALKAFIVRDVEQKGTLFSDRTVATKLVEQFFAHHLDKLLVAANLQPIFGQAQQQDQVLRANWETVNGWRESSRYELPGKAKSEELFEASSTVTDAAWRV